MENVYETILKADRVEAVDIIMPGLNQVKFVVTEVTDEVLAYLRENGLALLLTTYKLNVDITIHEDSRSFYEYGDYNPAEYSAWYEEDAQNILVEQTLITEF